VSALGVPRTRPLPSLRLADRTATAVLVVVVLLVLALFGGRLVGFRSLVERSGSMAPAIATGDLLLSHPVGAGGVKVGDIVTFANPLRPDVPTTHRVVALRNVGSRIAVTTRGDANPAAEQWSTPSAGRIQRVALRIPKAGYFVSTLSGPWVRLALLAGACTGLALVALRRIWRP
jgi:signal peptidase